MRKNHYLLNPKSLFDEDSRYKQFDLDLRVRFDLADRAPICLPEISSVLDQSNLACPRGYMMEAGWQVDSYLTMQTDLQKL